MENAQQLHQQTALQTGIQVGTGKAKMLQAIQNANQKFGVGTPEARNAILTVAGGDDADIRAALGHKALDTIIKPYTDMHDLAARRREFVQAFGREPTSVETTATGGINLRAGEEKSQVIPAKVLQDYSGLQADRAEQQSYLAQETDPKLKPPLQKKISVIDAQLQSYERQFPKLAPELGLSRSLGSPTSFSGPVHARRAAVGLGGRDMRSPP